MGRGWVRIGYICIGLIGVSLYGFAQTASPPIEEPPTRPVHLEEVIRFALQKNLDLQMARLQPEQSQAQILQERAPFEPQLLANFTSDKQESPTASILAGAPTIQNRSQTFDFTFTQRISWGTQFNVQMRHVRATTNSIFATLNPRYDTSLSFQIVQPLLRGFGPWNAQANLKAAEQRYTQSTLQFRETQMDLLLQVVQAYWDLVFARKNLEVQRNSLRLAEQLLRDTEIQIRVGTKAPIERTAAEAEVAVRRQNVIEAMNQLQAATDRLKALVEATEGLMHRPGEIWQPQEEPPTPGTLEPLEHYVDMALDQRPIIRAIQAQVTAAEYLQRAARNQLLPQLDFVIQYRWTGLGGDRQIFAGSFFERRVVNVIPGRFTDSINQVLRGEFPSWTFGFRLTLPINDTAARGRVLLAEAQLQQARIEMEKQRQNIVLQVRNAYRELLAAQQQYEAAVKSVQLQREKLQAEQKKLALGLSTNFVVLQYQQDLALAEQRQVQAQINYAKALAQLYRAIGRFAPDDIVQLFTRRTAMSTTGTVLPEQTADHRSQRGFVQ